VSSPFIFLVGLGFEFNFMLANLAFYHLSHASSLDARVFFLFVFAVLEFELRAFTLSYSTSPFL
jgi:hypothetical protein